MIWLLAVIITFLRVSTVSIRAYGAQDQFKRESYVRMDRYTRASLIYAALNRWVTIRVDTMGTTLTAILAWYLTYVADISASNAGFALSMAGEHSSSCGTMPFNDPRLAYYSGVQQLHPWVDENSQRLSSEWYVTLSGNRISLLV